MWEGVGEGRYDRRVPPVIEREEEAPPPLPGHRLGRPKGRTRGKASTWAGRRWARQAGFQKEKNCLLFFKSNFQTHFQIEFLIQNAFAQIHTSQKIKCCSINASTCV